GPQLGEIALAHIAAVKPDFDEGDLGAGTLGVSETYVLAYVEERLPTGSEASAWGGPLAPGFHLMQLEWDPAERGAATVTCQPCGAETAGACGESFRLREAAEGLQTRIEIRLGTR